MPSSPVIGKSSPPIFNSSDIQWIFSYYKKSDNLPNFLLTVEMPLERGMWNMESVKKQAILVEEPKPGVSEKCGTSFLFPAT
jgi:hypothetical protein